MKAGTGGYNNDHADSRSKERVKQADGSDPAAYEGQQQVWQAAGLL